MNVVFTVSLGSFFWCLLGHGLPLHTGFRKEAPGSTEGAHMQSQEQRKEEAAWTRQSECQYNASYSSPLPPSPLLLCILLLLPAPFFFFFKFFLYLVTGFYYVPLPGLELAVTLLLLLLCVKIKVMNHQAQL